MPAIELLHVSKTFVSEGGISRPGLTNICLSVDEGELVVLIGGNGSGKSTLLRSIAGFLNVDSGTISLFQNDVTSLSPQKRSFTVALVDQDPSRSCAADLSVAETIALTAQRRLRNEFWPLLSAKGVRHLQASLSQRSERLASLWHSTVAELSGGERQLLAIVTSAMRGCEIFLLDEHTAALDEQNSRLVWQLTLDLQQREGKTVLLVTHDIQRALSLPGRLVVMGEGMILHDVSGSARSELTREQIVQLYIGSPTIARLQ
jgi:putative ABC transport system ATP-binding protein